MIIVNYAKKEQTAAIKDLMIAANLETYFRYWSIECFCINESTEKVAQEVDLEDSPYSYKNILVAMNGDNIAGIAVSFEGEGTRSGELVIDCLAVHPLFRRKSVARRLLAATKERAGKLKLPRVGLLIDEDDAYGEAFCSANAMRLLRTQPNYSIAAISEASGFNHVRTLQRRIMDVTGMTPADYRALFTRDM